MRNYTPVVVLIGSLAMIAVLLGQMPASKPTPLDDFVVGKGVVHGNLTIFPVISKKPRLDDRFITLDEGLKSGMIEITEVSVASSSSTPMNAANPEIAVANQRPAASNDVPAQTESNELTLQVGDNDDLNLAFGQQSAAVSGNDVNRLMVLNKSDRPLYLMPGEILLGGDQDRTVGQELVIAPSKTPQPIAVFCVEHGRWGQRDPEVLARYLANNVDAQSWSDNSFVGEVNGDAPDASLVMSQTESIEKANSGKFIDSVGSLSKSARVAVQKDASQQAVWDEVAKENEKGGVKSQSGAFTGNYAEADALKRLAPYMEHLQKPIADEASIVGVIVAVNGEVETLDVFESTPLFKKLWPKLLKSYALDAVNSVDENTKPAICGRHEAVAFFAKASNASAANVDAQDSMSVAHSDADDVLVFSAHHNRRVAAEQPVEMNMISDVDSSSVPFDSRAIGGVGLSIPSRRERGYIGAGGGFGGAVHNAAFSK